MNPKKIIQLSSWILEVDKVARQKLDAQGVGVQGDIGRENGEGENWGELGGMGCVGWRKGGYGSREVNILIKGTILEFARDLTLEGFPGPRRCPQLVPWAAEKIKHSYF